MRRVGRRHGAGGRRPGLALLIHSAHVRRVATALAVALLTIAPAACGGDDSSDDTVLSSRQSVAVTTSLETIREYCRSVGRFLTPRDGAPTRPQAGGTADAARTLVEVGRQRPEGEYAQNQTMRTLLGDTAENLEATNCSPELVQILQRGLAELPPPPKI